MPDTTAPADVDSTPGPVPDRYDSLPLPHGALVIYDRRARERWIQSSEAIALESVR